MPERIDRRTALSAFGTAGLGALLAACSRDGGADGDSQPATTAGGTATTQPPSSVTPDLFADAATCTLTPEGTEGPFYFDVESIRRDIREDRPGVPLRLAIRVRDADACTPVADAVVDIWHCDALGVYSGFDRAEGATFLRGAQVTNADGIGEFVTAYPGWYPGRTVHIHAKVHVDNSTLLTTQLYFDEDVTAAVHTQESYTRDDSRDVFNDDDGIFDESLLLTLSPDGDGYLGLMSIDVAPS